MPCWFKKPTETVAYAAAALAVQLAFAATGVFFNDSWACLSGDSWVLHRMAVHGLENGVLSYLEPRPTLTQLPAYPWLIALSYRVCGQDPRFLLGLQMLLGSLIVGVFTAALRARLQGWRHTVGLALVFDPHRLLYSSCLLSEFWVWLAWMAGFLMFLRYEKTGRSSWLAAAFASFGLAALTKPLAGFFGPFLAAGLLVLKPRWCLARWKAFILALALYGGLLAPLLWRNARLTGEFPRYTTVSSFNSVYFNLAYYEAQKNGESLASARTRMVNLLRAELERQRGVAIPEISQEIACDRWKHLQALGVGEYEYAALSDTVFARYLKEDGPGYLRAHFRGALDIFTVSNLSWFQYWFHAYEARSFSGLGWRGGWRVLRALDLDALFLIIRLLEVATAALLLPLSLLGALLDKRNARDAAWLMAAFFIIYVAAVSGINVWGRFRYLFMPFWFVLSAHGLKASAATLQGWRAKP